MIEIDFYYRDQYNYFDYRGHSKFSDATVHSHMEIFVNCSNLAAWLLQLGLSQLCLKICLKCFGNFPKISPIMLGLFPIMLTVITAVSYVYTHN